MSAPGDIRVIVTVKNAVLLRVMEAEGFDTASALAKASRVDQGTVGLYLNLKLAPFDKNDELRPSIIRIAGVLHRLPEDLFPAPFLRRVLATNRAHRDVSSADIPALLGHNTPSIAYDPERSRVVADALASLEAGLSLLPPRRRRVLELRYGLNGERPHTLAEAGKALGVQQERVRQIQASAERTLKHPAHGLRSACAPLMDDDA